MDKKPLTTGEVADLCHVTHRCVLKWIEEKKLKTYNTPGGHYRIHEIDFLDFLRKYNMPIPIAFRNSSEKKRILIVDDDENMSKAIKRALIQEKKYEVDTGNDGFEAGRKLIEFMPDLVILDIRMPGINGYEVIRRMKAIPQDSKIKIIALSAFFEEEGKGKILSMGADACMDKPFETEELLKKIEEFLS